jgi:hypothetical protein
MNLRSVVAISITVLSISVASPLYAAPLATPLPLHAMFAKTKMVKLSLRNATSVPLELKVGDTVMTIDAGKTVDLRLAIGTRILSNVSTASHQAGALLAEVTTALDSATISIK